MEKSWDRVGGGRGDGTVALVMGVADGTASGGDGGGVCCEALEIGEVGCCVVGCCWGGSVDIGPHRGGKIRHRRGGRQDGSGLVVIEPLLGKDICFSEAGETI